MDLLQELMTIILTISNSLLYPVLILLIMLVALLFLFLGELLSEYSKRTRNIGAVDESLRKSHLADFYLNINKIISENNDEKLLTIKINRMLSEYENRIMKKLEKTRLLIRIGPMLGLMGTLIPLGPALLGLSAGNIEQLAKNLVIAFTTTVVGLLIGVIAVVVTAVRQRWYMKDMNDMEYISEMLMETKENEKNNKIHA
jgi:biopolymer transport protein ExbB/TolQ